ncbi:hypothetical protein VaNZ11_008238 [Volvox africanus]|uniref:Uncharacterized protein n=1 Tax=Volvox africanus TaxID=51714 RepID=A0ABQ5S5C7_9CHLO|nr:hypothetical protein VaNZ11_008238 [Volvox africanus]
MHRGLGPATLVLLSFITQQAPSAMALWGMKTWPFMDIGFNAMFPTTPAVEVVYGILSLGWMVTLGLHYQHTHPDFQLHLPLRILVCLASTSWLVLFQFYRRGASQNRNPPSGKINLARTAVLSSGPGVLDAERAGTSRPVSGSDQGSSEASSCTSAGMVGAHTVAACIAATRSNPTSASNDVSGEHTCCRHMLYKGFPGRWYSIHVKIGNADVKQVQEGYVNRIACVLAEVDLHLHQLYIRRGCIDLTMDAWTASNKVDSSGGAADCEPDVDIGAVIRALHLNWNREDIDVNEVDLDTTTDVTVTELDSTDMRSSESLSTSAPGSSSNEPRLLSTECRPWSSQQGQGQVHNVMATPRIIGLHPRVLAVPQAPASGDANAAPEPPAVNMVIAINWPTSGTSNVINRDGGPEAIGLHGRELVLRSQGLYLPIAVESETIGSTEQAGIGLFGDADSSAAPDVAQRMSYMYSVQVSGLPPCMGLMLAEARMQSGSVSRPMPILILDDLEVCSELVAVLSDWQGTADELDVLIVDLGTFFSQSVAAQLRHLSCGSGASGSANALHVWRLICMGDHLLQYALACHWGRTAARLREGMQLLRQFHAAGQPSLPSSIGSASDEDAIQPGTHTRTAPAYRANDSTASQAATLDRAGVCACTNSTTETASSHECGGSGSVQKVAEELEFTMCSQPCGPCSQHDFKRGNGQAGPCKVRSATARLLNEKARRVRACDTLPSKLQIYILVLELVVLLLLRCLRWQHTPVGSGASFFVYAGAAVGGYYHLTAGVEPMRRRLAQSRLMLYLLVRSLQGAVCLAVPPLAVAYDGGVGIILVEGIARPAFWGVESAVAARIELIRLPLYIIMWGSRFTPSMTIARAVAVTGLSVWTSFACRRLFRNELGKVSV